jgi:hypothetical protein
MKATRTIKIMTTGRAVAAILILLLSPLVAARGSCEPFGIFDVYQRILPPGLRAAECVGRRRETIASVIAERGGPRALGHAGQASATIVDETGRSDARNGQPLQVIRRIEHGAARPSHRTAATFIHDDPG